MTSAYLNDVFDKSPRQRKVWLDRMCRKVEALQKKLKFKAIAVRGVSGLLVGPYISYQLGLELIVVRKAAREHDHATAKVESGAFDKFLIIDDLIHTGSTIRQILIEINRDSYMADLDCVGILLYVEEYDEPYFRYKNMNIPIFFYPSKMQAKVEWIKSTVKD